MTMFKIGRLGQLALASSALVLAACGGTTQTSGEASDALVKQVEASFPNTTFEKIYHHDATGLLAAETGNKVIFLTADATHVLAGEVFDLESKTNISEVRERELAAANALEASLTGAGGKAVQAVAGEAPARAARAPQDREAGATMDVDLPMENMVVHNPGGSQVLYVVADYNCGYCKRLYAEMQGMDVEIREIPVSYLSPDSGIKGASVLCSDDKAAAADAFLTGSADTRITTCTEGERQVEQNTSWAQERGIGGTPFMIRATGETQSGYLPSGRLKAFLGIS